MDPYPHHYSVTATSSSEGEVTLESPRLPSLVSAPPAEFGGPGDRWSPETLCVSAVADCFILTFRAIARASKLPWSSLRCDVEGTLDRVDRVAQFTSFLVRASLQVPTGTSEEQALGLLERAEKSCLITNSLKGASHLEAKVEVR
jgi:organic hydroperoxide reductase OsmC/OhrA